MPKQSKPPKLVRSAVLIREETDRELRRLAEAGNRPVAREIRQALEAHVEREKSAA